MVRTPQAAGDEAHRQLAPDRGHPFSWGIALFEYSFQVPANRIGFVDNGGPFNLVQLKVIQEVVSLTIFSLFTILVFKGQTFHWNHIAAFVCLILAVYFVFMK